MYFTLHSCTEHPVHSFEIFRLSRSMCSTSRYFVQVEMYRCRLHKIMYAQGSLKPKLNNSYGISLFHGATYQGRLRIRTGSLRVDLFTEEKFVTANLTRPSDRLGSISSVSSSSSSSSSITASSSSCWSSLSWSACSI